MSATIKDIAKKCGVSEGTVDRALNNREGIKKETKEFILKVAEELNYKPNHLASCLA
ncbi:MAG: LacI family DNA-binding transcriptional regulator, partial [Lachnospiraceae bacterium]|nr:LacI family DNA-binding transcriptional regulator [Lachnospiraceae bacterium]